MVVQLRKYEIWYCTFRVTSRKDSRVFEANIPFVKEDYDEKVVIQMVMRQNGKRDVDPSDYILDMDYKKIKLLGQTCY